MADLTFMQKRYSLDALVTHYLDEIKKLRTPGLTPIDETKLQNYYQAAHVFKRISVMEIVQFALSYGRNATGKSEQMREAFPTILSNRVAQPTKIDVAYARLLFDYAKAFKQYRSNLKEWTLRFLLSSRFSPVSAMIEREIEQVIIRTKQKISAYEAQIK